MDPVLLKYASSELDMSLAELVAQIEAGEIDCVIFEGEHAIPAEEIDRFIKEKK